MRTLTQPLTVDGQTITHCVIGGTQYLIVEIIGKSQDEALAILRQDRSHLYDWMPTGTKVEGGYLVAFAKEDLRSWEALFQTHEREQREVE